MYFCNSAVDFKNTDHLMDKNKQYILIAEDDEDDRILLKSAFVETASMIELVFVENGVELMDYFNTLESGPGTFPSLLILDLNMPKKNGKEVLAELRDKAYFENFKTVIFSTTSCETEKGNCLDYGVARYFVKPTGYKDLLHIVSEFQELAGLGREALH